MDLKEIKKLVHFARKAGVKSIAVNGVSVEFKDELIITPARKPRLVRPAAIDGGKKDPEPHKDPTLDEINQFIYGQSNEAG